MTQGLEGVPAIDPPDQAERRWRPLSRLDLMMACPARVDIRWRNPCLLARRRLFGWYVLFTHCLLGPGCVRSSPVLPSEVDARQPRDLLAPEPMVYERGRGAPSTRVPEAVNPVATA
jgi:hypothetical protein